MPGNVDVGPVFQDGKDLLDHRVVVLVLPRGVDGMVAVDDLPRRLAYLELFLEPLLLDVDRGPVLALLRGPHDRIGVQGEELNRSGCIGIVSGRQAPGCALLRIEGLRNRTGRVVVVVVP